MLNMEQIRRDFPILHTTQHGKPLVYLDNAATMQMPVQVQTKIMEHYRHCNANVHRGVHSLSRCSTDALENARKTVAGFIGAETDEVVFTAGTTDSVNQLAHMLDPSIQPGQQILVSAMEHHSNLLPWQELCSRTGATLAIIPMDGSCDLDLAALRTQLKQKTALVAVTWVSNVLGTVNPIDEIITLAHEAGALILVDGAQGMKLGVTDVHSLDCDFLAFSGHKLGALTGIGILYGKRTILDALPPAAFGGGMVQNAEYQSSCYGAVPQRFEAGTPNYVGAISLECAIAYMQSIGMNEIAAYEQHLTDILVEQLHALPEISVLGKPKHRCGVVSLCAPGIHAYDLGVMLDAQGIAVRTGHLCAQPLARYLGHENVLRVSPAFYNSEAEINVLISAFRKALPILKGAIS